MDKQAFLGGAEQKSEKKGFTLFKKKEEAPTGPNISDVLSQIATAERRLKMLEERNTDLNRKVEVTDKGMLNERKIVTREIKTIDSDVLDLKRQLNEIKNKQDMIVGELKGYVGREEVAALKKYIELWEPVNFVSRNEVEKIIDEKLDELKEKKKSVQK